MFIHSRVYLRVDVGLRNGPLRSVPLPPKSLSPPHASPQSFLRRTEYLLSIPYLKISKFSFNMFSRSCTRAVVPVRFAPLITGPSSVLPSQLHNFVLNGHRDLQRPCRPLSLSLGRRGTGGSGGVGGRLALPKNVFVWDVLRRSCRPVSYWRRGQEGGRLPPTYSRFSLEKSQPTPHHGQFPPNQSYFSLRFAQLLWLWQTDPRFRYGVLVIAIGGGIFYVLNLERIPISDRLRFNCIPREWEERLSREIHQQLLRQYGRQILPSGHPSSRMVQTVLDRLIPVSGALGLSWEVVVIDDPKMMNAFVTPG